MSLDELNDALDKLGLDIKNNPEDVKIRDAILFLHGSEFLNVKKKRCLDCWLKQHGKCGPMCQMYVSGNDPVEVSKSILSQPNDIKMFPFLFMYMIPVYEKVTGHKNTVKELAREFKKRWIAEKNEDPSSMPNFN